MIYNVDHNFVFVHIPRTGGLSITRAILDALPDSYINLVEWRHRYAMEIQFIKELHPIFPDMYKFTIVRDPWEIVESDYSLMIRDIQEPTLERRMHCQHRWLERIQRVAKYSGFVEFVAREYLGGLSPVLDGGFYQTWCLKMNGESLGVRPILFQNLEQEWPRICEEISIPVCRLTHENGVNRQKCVWSRKARDAIGDICRKDVELFNFEFRGTLAS